VQNSRNLDRASQRFGLSSYAFNPRFAAKFLGARRFPGKDCAW
jgi:hypothetical protein